MSPSLTRVTSASLPARTAGTHARARSHTPGRGRSGSAASTGRARAHPRRPPHNPPPRPPSPRDASRAARRPGPRPCPRLPGAWEGASAGAGGGGSQRGAASSLASRLPHWLLPLPLLPPPRSPIGSLSYSIPSHLFPFTHWREYFSSAFPFLRILLLLCPILHALEDAGCAAPSTVVFKPSLLSPFPSVPVSGRNRANHNTAKKPDVVLAVAKHRMGIECFSVEPSPVSKR